MGNYLPFGDAGGAFQQYWSLGFEEGRSPVE
jgi:hypothetical protein